MSSENEPNSEESGPVTEADYNELFCDEVGGELEVAHSYNFGSGTAYVYVDCETSDTVWEGGLDRRSSLERAYTKKGDMVPLMLNEEDERGD